MSSLIVKNEKTSKRLTLLQDEQIDFPGVTLENTARATQKKGKRKSQRPMKWNDHAVAFHAGGREGDGWGYHMIFKCERLERFFMNAIDFSKCIEVMLEALTLERLVRLNTCVARLIEKRCKQEG